jgi:4,5-dihydroxyphthalate decarboxylase
MAPNGKKLGQMLIDGEIDAAIGADGAGSPDIRPLIPNAPEAEIAWFEKHGVYPINHMLTVRNDLIAEHPGILKRLFAAFSEARRRYVQRLAGPGPFSPADESMIRLQGIVGDPLPYGVGPNRRAIDMAARFAYEQHIVPKLYTVEDLFGPEVMRLGQEEHA